MRLNPGLSLIRLAPDTVQIGSGVRSTQLSGCSEQVMAFLEALRVGIPSAGEAAAVRRCGLDPAEARSVVSSLEGFLHHGDPPAGPGPGHAADLLGQDVRAALAAGPAVTDGHGRSGEIVARRRDTGIQVLGLGRTGATVARTLAAAGIGSLTLWDRDVVSISDLGTGYLPADLGRIRPVALARRIDDVGLDPVVLPLTSPARPCPGGDATVLVGLGAADPEAIALARAADHPLLPVVVRDDDVLIGPWCAPRAVGCPQCWDLAAAQADPWRTARVAALAAGRAGQEDAALAVAAGALAAHQVVRWVDTGHAAGGAMLHLHSATGRVDTLTVPPHPDCACAAPALRPASSR